MNIVAPEQCTRGHISSVHDSALDTVTLYKVNMLIFRLNIIIFTPCLNKQTELWDLLVNKSYGQECERTQLIFMKY